jgi:thioredoxin-dependent peroxiredoxin
MLGSVVMRMLRVGMLLVRVWGVRMRLMLMRRMSVAQPTLTRMLGTGMIVASHALSGVPRQAQRTRALPPADISPGAALGRYPWNRLHPPNASGKGEFDGPKTTKGRHMAHELAAGEKAPTFTMPNAGGKTVSLKDFKGRNLVLYFYPKADTPGCTKEAIAFSSLRGAFAKLGTDILGVSADPVAALAKFKTKHDLKIALASDETRKMLQAYGAWGEKSMYGRKYMGIMRKTFLIDAQGRIAQVWPKVSVPGHAEAVLEAARNL